MTFNFKQGVYEVIHKEKYVGSENPFFRSGLEERVMYFMDNNKNVLKWNSERVVIPYISPVDGRMHRYFVDFYAKMTDLNGGVCDYLIEVKPYEQTKPPTQPKNKNKKAQNRYLRECATFAVNQAKWKSAEEFSLKKGLVFAVVTEKDIHNLI